MQFIESIPTFPFSPTLNVLCLRPVDAYLSHPHFRPRLLFCSFSTDNVSNVPANCCRNFTSYDSTFFAFDVSLTVTVIFNEQPFFLQLSQLLIYAYTYTLYLFYHRCGCTWISIARKHITINEFVKSETSLKHAIDILSNIDFYTDAFTYTYYVKMIKS